MRVTQAPWELGAGQEPETSPQPEDRAESWNSKQALGSLTLENPEAEVGRNGATHTRGESHGVQSSPRLGPHQVRAAVAAPARPVETHRSIEQAQVGNPVPREGRVPGRRAVQPEQDLSLPGLEDRVPVMGLRG